MKNIIIILPWIRIKIAPREEVSTAVDDDVVNPGGVGVWVKLGNVQLFAGYVESTANVLVISGRLYGRHSQLQSVVVVAEFFWAHSTRSGGDQKKEVKGDQQKNRSSKGGGHLDGGDEVGKMVMIEDLVFYNW